MYIYAIILCKMRSGVRLAEVDRVALITGVVVRVTNHRYRCTIAPAP